MPEDKLLSAHKASESDKIRIEMIREELKKLQHKFHDNDKAKYKGIRSIRNLLDLPIDEDYYKPI